jgi:lysine biosynthesis protein LysW
MEEIVMVRCPECNATLAAAVQLALGDQIYCGECEALLEVVNVDPLELEYLFDKDLDDEDDLDDLDDLEDLDFDSDDEDDFLFDDDKDFDDGKDGP